jgi:hypothetical protein
MDISYASAWQLGKTLALADPTFTAALSRLRTTIHNDALEAARKDIFKRLRGGSGDSLSHQRLSVLCDLSSRSSYMPKNEIKADIADIVGALNSINAGVRATGTSFSTNRWNRKSHVTNASADLFSLRSEHIFHQMHTHAEYLAGENAKTADGGLYNYHTVPENTDYAVLQEWILDKLHLAGIPAHYLLPDPSHVPPETLRFFHIDANWTDALVDGALSLANHLSDEPSEDFTRSALKDALNRYFSTPIVGDYCQQMPAYGFILRSQLLVQFPDLAVGADFEEILHTHENWADVKPKAPILVQRRLASDVMLVLFDREPPYLTSLSLTLPAHQQTFIAAFGFSETSDEVEMHYKRIYATGPDAALPELDQSKRHKQLNVPNEEFKFNRSRIFDWETRTLKIQEYADVVHKNLRLYMPPGQYSTEVPTSAVFALQLNEPIYTLTVTATTPKQESPGELAVRSRRHIIKKSLNGWDMLYLPDSFRFFPPTFPAERYAPKTALPEPIIAPTFQPTKLLLARNALALSRKSWVVLPKQNLEDIGTDRPSAPHPVDFPPINFAVFPLGSPKGNVLTNNSIPSDLVFDLRADPYLKYWKLRVTHFDLKIPISSFKDDSKKPPIQDPNANRALLNTDEPEGSPPTMLSNSRFNVLRQKWDLDKGWLYISIVPRTKWGVGMKFFKEASFWLPLSRVYPWKVPTGERYQFEIQLKAYMRNPGDPKDAADTVYKYSFISYMESS